MVTQTALQLRAAIVIIVLGLASLACAPTGSAEMSASALKFDTATWKMESGAAGKRKQRARMLGDLQANHLKTGMLRKDVITLLGVPDVDKGDELTYFFGSDYSNSSSLSFFGSENDGGMLVFYLRKTSRVKNIRAIRWHED